MNNRDEVMKRRTNEKTEVQIMLNLGWITPTYPVGTRYGDIQRAIRKHEANGETVAIIIG